MSQVHDNPDCPARDVVPRIASEMVGLILGNITPEEVNPLYKDHTVSDVLAFHAGVLHEWQPGGDECGEQCICEWNRVPA